MTFAARSPAAQGLQTPGYRTKNALEELDRDPAMAGHQSSGFDPGPDGNVSSSTWEFRGALDISASEVLWEPRCYEGSFFDPKNPRQGRKSGVEGSLSR